MLRVGDEVVFEIGPEARIWHSDVYRNIPDGAKGVVCGFYDAILYYGRTGSGARKQGVYHHKGAVSVWLPDGRIVPGDCHVQMVDKDEEKRRDVAMRDERGVLRHEEVRLGDLPSTQFWEEDRVTVRLPNRRGGVNEEEAVVARIDYGSIHKRRDGGSPWPFYDLRLWGGGVGASAEESWMTLVERGPVWKFYHGEPIGFASINEEAKFFDLIGRTEEVRNPANGLYDWTEEEAIGAIRSGIGHSISVSISFLGSDSRISVKRFRDGDLGQRVARATLERFGLTSA